MLQPRAAAPRLVHRSGIIQPDGSVKTEEAYPAEWAAAERAWEALNQPFQRDRWFPGDRIWNPFGILQFARLLDADPEIDAMRELVSRWAEKEFNLSR
jgi:hypothetical protein